MERRIAQFITALRGSGLRVSLAESADAFKAVQVLGIQDREAFRTTLRATLVKEQADIAVFEQLFPLFFQAAQPPAMQDAAAQLSPEDASKLAKALRQFAQELRERMEKLLNGEPLTAQELEQLSQLVNSDPERDLRYQKWLARQMEEALNFKEVRKALEELLEILRQMGMNRKQLEKLRQALQANQQALRDQIQQQAGEAILNNLSEYKKHDPQDDLLNRPFQAFSEEDMSLLRDEVRRLAAALRTRLALRLHRARTGRLDPKATLRANLKNGSVPIELRYRDRSLKPKLVVICDISTSMRFCSELMLSLLYAIQDQISKTHAFIFINRLEYITPHFTHGSPAQAIQALLERMPPGHYNTNLGYSLENFNQRYRDTVDHRTTFIIVGDGRNNYNDPRIDLFKELARRARSTIWLNPEPPVLWGTGDSDMALYAPLCNRTFQVANLRQLAAAIDQLLVQ